MIYNDLKSFIDFIKNIEPEEYKMFLQFLEKYRNKKEKAY